MLTLRKATAKDARTILSLVRELATYEREPKAVIATVSDIRRHGFSKKPKFQAIIAEWNGKPAGMVLFFPYYSTWQGRSGVFVEDLIIRKKFRRRGVGFALISQLARLAIADGGSGMRWEVYSWNKDAIRFYRKIGASFRPQGRVMQVKKKDLAILARTNLVEEKVNE